MKFYLFSFLLPLFFSSGEGIPIQFENSGFYRREKTEKLKPDQYITETASYKYSPLQYSPFVSPPDFPFNNKKKIEELWEKLKPDPFKEKSRKGENKHSPATEDTSSSEEDKSKITASSKKTADEDSDASKENQETASSKKTADEDSDASKENQETASSKKTADEDSDASKENQETASSKKTADEDSDASKENQETASSKKTADEDSDASKENQETALSFESKDRPLDKSKSALTNNSCTMELKIEETIGPATLNALERAIYMVQKQNCSAMLLLINTPGGQLLSTRKIVDRILNTDFPVLCLIYPAGAHAGSAGAIIMQACHVNGGIEASNIGAATPIMGGGQKMSDDLRKKMINDTTAWLDSLTQLRKRSKKFGREIVTEAKSLSATEAVKEKAIDFAGKTKKDFLQFAEGRKVTVKDGKNHTVQVGDIIPIKLGFRHKLISLITEPEIIYILFVGSLLLLYFEITHPGLGAPGILGTMGLILSFIGMHKLDFSWAGLILLLFSMGLFLVEVFITGFGIFGASAIVSFVLGSFLLFDPNKTGGVDIPVSLILSVTFIFALLMSGITYLAWKTFKMKKKTNISDDFIDPDAPPAEVTHVNEDGVSGLVFTSGENWRFQSSGKVKKGDKVQILSYKRLLLEVEPYTQKETLTQKTKHTSPI